MGHRCYPVWGTILQAPMQIEGLWTKAGAETVLLECSAQARKMNHTKVTSPMHASSRIAWNFCALLPVLSSGSLKDKECQSSRHQESAVRKVAVGGSLKCPTSNEDSVSLKVMPDHAKSHCLFSLHLATAHRTCWTFVGCSSVNWPEVHCWIRWYWLANCKEDHVGVNLSALIRVEQAAGMEGHSTIIDKFVACHTGTSFT